MASGTGTKEDPWVLQTPPGTSEYRMWRDDAGDPPAIICQVGAKENTDAARLFQFCEARAFEKEFFIRKAIGWALRQHARVDPGAVARFVIEHRDHLSGLSYREATKHIGHLLPS